MQKEVITLFEEISPQELNKCLQKFICQQGNMTAAQLLRAKFFKVLATVKIIIFVLNYVTVLSYTKTLHQNGGG